MGSHLLIDLLLVNEVRRHSVRLRVRGPVTVSVTIICAIWLTGDGHAV